MMLIIPCVVGLFVMAEPIIQYLFEYGAWTHESTHAVALAMMIQVFALPAMMISQIYSKTLYASQDVRTPVKTSIISLAVAIAIYLGAFHFVGYLAIPIGVVVSGYLKNYLLMRACRRRNLIHTERRTILAIAAFSGLAVIMGVGLWMVPVTGLLSMLFTIGGFAVIYLPLAYLINKKI